jgi:hypothetical protein
MIIVSYSCSFSLLFDFGESGCDIIAMAKISEGMAMEEAAINELMVAAI